MGAATVNSKPVKYYDMTTVRACASFIKLCSQYEQTVRVRVTSKRASLYFCALSPSHKMAIIVVSYFLSKEICEVAAKENICAPGHMSERSAAAAEV